MRKEHKMSDPCLFGLLRNDIGKAFWRITKSYLKCPEFSMFYLSGRSAAVSCHLSPMQYAERNMNVYLWFTSREFTAFYRDHLWYHFNFDFLTCCSSAPFALVFWNIGLVAVHGLQDLPKNCLAIAGGRFGLAILFDALCDILASRYTQNSIWVKLIPIPSMLGIPAFMNDHWVRSLNCIRKWPFTYCIVFIDYMQSASCIVCRTLFPRWHHLHWCYCQVFPAPMANTIALE